MPAPCGRCRQVLADLHPDADVLVPTPQGPDAVPVRDLPPHGCRQPDARAPPLLHLVGRHHDDVLAGRKTVTIRHDDPAGLGPVPVVFEDGEREGHRTVAGVVGTGALTASPTVVALIVRHAVDPDGSGRSRP